MSFFQAVISTVARAFADLVGVVPIGEYNATPPSLADGEGCNLQSDGAGNLKVAIAGSATLPDGAATALRQDTGNAALASILAQVSAAATQASLASLLSVSRDLATEASLASLLSEVHAKVPAKGQAAMAASVPVVMASDQSALRAATYNATTPSLSDGNVRGLEIDQKGCLHVTQTMRDSWEVVFSSGLAADASSLPNGACQRICVDTDNLLVYYQPPGRALIASQSGAAWTGAAGWSREGNVWTHAAGGGTGDLEITTDATVGVRVGKTYCVVYTVTITAGTSVTAKLGTGAGSARTTTGTYVQLVTAATNGKIIFTPTNDLACTIDVTSVYVIPHGPVFQAMVDYERAAVKIVAVASASTPATAHTTAKVWALWNRRLGAAEVT